MWEGTNLKEEEMKIPRGADLTRASHIERLVQRNWGDLTALEKLYRAARNLHSSHHNDAPRAADIGKRIYKRMLWLRREDIATVARK